MSNEGRYRQRLSALAANWRALAPLANRAESARWRKLPSIRRYPTLRVMERNMKIPYESFAL